jgi:murein DD-endopeptidase MepM/ murein hydrolase activator NlpD
VLTAFVVIPGTGFSESLQEAAKKVILLDEEKEKLQTEISYFDEQIKFLTEEIKKKDEEIKVNELRLAEIQAELQKKQDFLSENMRILWEEEQVSFWERLFAGGTISEIFSKDVYLESVRERLVDATNSISNLKKEEEERKIKLDNDRRIQETMRVSLALEKAESEMELETVEKEERIVREKFARMLSGKGVKRYCAGEGKVIKAKYSVFRFPVTCGYISQGYGNTVFAAVDKAYKGAIHNGFDVGVGLGTPIYAIGNGTVYGKGRTPANGWGNWVMIKHDPVKIDSGQKDKDGNIIYTDMVFYSLSAHMVSETHLAIGERVEPNTVIGFVGGTPNWASHLHLSLLLSASKWTANGTGEYPGNTVDPLNYMDIPISTQGTDWDVRYVHY